MRFFTHPATGKYWSRPHAREVATRVLWMRSNEDYSRQCGAICGLSAAPDAANEREKRYTRALFASQWKDAATAQVVMAPLIFIHAHAYVWCSSNYRKISLVQQLWALLKESAETSDTIALLQMTMGKEKDDEFCLRNFDFCCWFNLHLQATQNFVSSVVSRNSKGSVCYIRTMHSKIILRFAFWRWFMRCMQLSQ